ncbi:MAG: DNA methylase [Alteromonas sp.]|nr:DNA methylase [Alteromonas sp.]MAY21978.1 DNA methylase [Flavobacteriaceae bacterium]|tara:strand:- start:456 stop:821 length:366 start_codon:yes stop_codon:yes gene_type:complete
MANKIIPYRSDLKELARRLRSEMTPAEKTLWKVIRKKALNVEFHRQVPLLDYIVDFYCHEIGLAIEVDGNIHNTSFLEDAKRQGRLELYGIRFYRVQNEEVLYHLEKVLNDLKELIEDSDR